MAMFHQVMAAGKGEKKGKGKSRFKGERRKEHVGPLINRVDQVTAAGKGKGEGKRRGKSKGKGDRCMDKRWAANEQG